MSALDDSSLPHRLNAVREGIAAGSHHLEHNGSEPGFGPESGQANFPIPVRFIFLIIVILFGASVVWSNFVKGKSEQEAELASLPLLSADSNEFRIRPDTPGGMEIPHADSTLYGALDGELNSDKMPEPVENSDNSSVSAAKNFAGSKQFAGLEDTLKTKLGEELSADKTVPAQLANKKPIENLAKIKPQKIEPKKAELQKTQSKKTEDKRQIKTHPDNIKTESVTTPSVAIRPTVKPKKPAPQKTPLVQEIKQAKVPSKDKEAIKPPTTANESGNLGTVIDRIAADQASKPKQTPPATSTGNYFVQLGSVKSEQAAHSEWRRLAGKYPGILNKSLYRVHKADLKERGVFYRIQAGPYEKKSAQTTCDALKSAKKPGGCLVVRK